MNFSSQSAQILLLFLTAVLVDGSVSKQRDSKNRILAVGDQLCPETFWIENDEGEEAGVPYCASHPLDEPNEDITRAVIVMHGRSYNPLTYFDNMKEAANLHNARERTLVIAPQIVRQKFIDGLGLDYEDYLAFSSKWVYGTNSATPFSYSSFELMDEFLAAIDDADLFPYLSNVVIAGHSAGGQFVQRYAMSSIYEPHNFEITYFLANPSSYAYLSTQRFLKGKSSCERYNHWGYGLRGMYEYSRLVGTTKMREQYGRRNVVYAIGELDNKRDKYITDTCGADMQGFTRYERAQYFFEHLREYYGEPVHTLIEVAGARHDHRDIFWDEEIRYLLFGSDEVFEDDWFGEWFDENEDTTD